MASLADQLRPDSRAGAWLATALALITVVVMAWEAARLTWLLWPTASSTPPPAAADATPLSATPPQAAGPGIESILAAHPFGMADAGATPAEDAPVDAPDTTLDLTLNGILYDSDSSQSRALITPQRGETGVFSVGAEVTSGASIRFIHSDRVILSRDGRLEALRLAERRLQGATATTPPAPTETDSTTTLSQLRQRIADDPGALQQMLQPQPAYDDAGNLQGFRITPGSDQALLEASGLQAGDLVTEIAGITLDSQTASMEAMERMSNAERVTITVERDGESRRLLLDFRE